MALPVWNAATGATGTSTSSNASLNHADNVLIVVSISYEGITSPVSPTGVTVGGVNATYLASSKVSYLTDNSSEIWYIYRASSANESVVVTFASSTRHAWNAVSYTNCINGAGFYEQLLTGNNTGVSPVTDSVVTNTGTLDRLVVSSHGSMQSAAASGSITIVPADSETQRGTTEALAGSGSDQALSNEFEEYNDGNLGHANRAKHTKISATLWWTAIGMALLPNTVTTTDNHTTSSYLVKQTANNHTTDDYLVLQPTKTHTTDSYLKYLGTTRIHTSDSYLVLQPTKIHTTDSVIANLVTKTHTTDSVIANLVTKTHITDDYLVLQPTKTHTIDSVIANLVTKTHTTDSVIANLVTKTHTTDSVIANLVTKTHITDDYLVLQPTKIHTTDYLLNHRVVIRNHTIDSYLSIFSVPMTPIEEELGIYTGTYGVPILIDTGIDTSNAIAVSIEVKKPDNTTVSWVAGKYVATMISRVVEEEDFNLVGRYYLQPKLVYSNGNIFYGTTLVIRIHDKFN